VIGSSGFLLIPLNLSSPSRCGLSNPGCEGYEERMKTKGRPVKFTHSEHPRCRVKTCITMRTGGEGFDNNAGNLAFISAFFPPEGACSRGNWVRRVLVLETIQSNMELLHNLQEVL